MKSKMYWGLTIFILLLVTAAVFVFLREIADNRELDTQLTEAEELVEQINQRKISENNHAPKESVDGQQTDNQIGDNLSDARETDGTPDVQETNGIPDFWSLTPEQRQAIFDQYYHQIGLKPPPRGYRYRWVDENVPLLDENGDPVLHKIGEPEVHIKMGIGPAPTREELEEYYQLKRDMNLAIAHGDLAEHDRLLAAVDAFEASVQRIRPVHVYTVSIGSEAKSKSDRVTDEKMHAALREHGLEHLISTPFEH